MNEHETRPVASLGSQIPLNWPAGLQVVHTSDLHLGSSALGIPEDDPRNLDLLQDVLSAARGAHLLLIVGDMFDNNRLPTSLLEATAHLLAAAELQVVILPGNHDPLTADSVYRRGPIGEPANVSILGLTEEHQVRFPDWDLEVWGCAHFDYSDMRALGDAPLRTTRWQIALAHGQYDDAAADSGWWPSWRIRSDELAAAGADYIALGHWNRAERVGGSQVCAYYSGAPDLAGTVNFVRLADHGVHVRRERVGRGAGVPPERSSMPGWPAP